MVKKTGTNVEIFMILYISVRHAFNFKYQKTQISVV